MLALRGVVLVQPSQAEVDVYITVDAFGTCRDRYEYHVYNKESLIGKTALSMTAFARKDRSVVMPPTTAAYEAEYVEEFIAWCGPFGQHKAVRRSDPLLVDFKDVARGKGVRQVCTCMMSNTRSAPATMT